jgi:hypothetical protein
MREMVHSLGAFILVTQLTHQPSACSPASKDHGKKKKKKNSTQRFSQSLHRSWYSSSKAKQRFFFFC